MVAGGSIVGGRRYELIDARPPVELSAWLAELLAPQASPATGTAPAGTLNRDGYVAAAVAGEVRRVLDAGVGARSAALNQAAWNLGRLVGAGQLARADVERALQHAAEAAGYWDGPRAAAAVITAALDARLCRA